MQSADDKSVKTPDLFRNRMRRVARRLRGQSAARTCSSLQRHRVLPPKATAQNQESSSVGGMDLLGGLPASRTRLMPFHNSVQPAGNA